MQITTSLNSPTLERKYWTKAMHRHQNSNLNIQQNYQELDKQTAFHEAGHAAAIYLRNKTKHLPAVNLEIHIEKTKQQHSHFSAKVVNGLLVQDLPQTILDNLAELNLDEQHSYQQAYEADVVNLLAGPIAEAKYVSIRDDELINRNLLSIQALRHYGGHTDLERAHAHLMQFIGDQSQREAKMRELFDEAYSFIDNSSNWTCILNLAHFILDSNQSTITNEEISSIFYRCAA